METMEAVLTRRSVRSYNTDKAISKEDMQDILRAAQYAPTAVNTQAWEFVVIENKNTLSELKNCQDWIKFAKDAAAVIMVCVDTEKCFHDSGWTFADIDGALACQNIMLVAHSKGIGSCMCAISPIPETVKKTSQYFALPANIHPVAFVVLGYPNAKPQQPNERYSAQKVHFEKY